MPIVLGSRRFVRFLPSFFAYEVPMYRWQTLTLARIEHLNHDITRAQIDSARDALIAIGSQHFPEPAVTFSVDPVGAWLNLAWTVDDREWQISIDANGERHDSGVSPNDSWSGIIGGADREHIRSSAQWLLFGHTIGPREDKAQIASTSTPTKFGISETPVGFSQGTKPAAPHVAKMQPPPGSCFLIQ